MPSGFEAGCQFYNQLLTLQFTTNPVLSIRQPFKVTVALLVIEFTELLRAIDSIPRDGNRLGAYVHTDNTKIDAVVEAILHQGQCQ